ncbi:leucyl aminopeptidase [bacterium]|nr:leucyl aminopeptidase [bacterium]
MVKINTITESILEVKTDGIAFILEDGFEVSKDIKNKIKEFGIDILKLFKKQNFTGKAKSSVSILIPEKNGFKNVFFVGMGCCCNKMEKIAENYRQAIGIAIGLAEKNNIESLAIEIPEGCKKFKELNEAYFAHQTVKTAIVASYKFNEFLTSKEKKDKKLKELILVSKGKNKKLIEERVELAKVLGNAVNEARRWIDLPANKFYPAIAEEEARKIAKEQGLKIKVFGEDQIKKMGMGGLAGVSSGSEQDCKFIILEYKTSKKNAKTLAFIGKGVTFDSGGLSLKPSRGPGSMETMKEDMSGASAVLGAMKAIAQLKPDVNVFGVLAVTENLPGDGALKPGDIVTFYNGKTGEVLNTDAEGRLILADALAYTEKELKPDVMIDIATLTGACVYAVGPFYSGLFSCNENLIEKIKEAGNITGDKVWPLPIDSDYRKAMLSDIADVRNTSKPGYYAGATTAALFLKEFVKETEWAHIDIGGTAFNVPDRPYLGNGATGVGVSLLVELAMNWNKKK